MSYRFVGLICTLVLMISLQACILADREIDAELVRSELTQLNNDLLTESLPSNNWELFIRLGQLSSDTKWFLGQRHQPSFLEFVPLHISEFLENIQPQIEITKQGIVKLINPAPPPSHFRMHITNTEEVATIIRNEYQKIRASNEVYAYSYNIDDRDNPIKHLCKHECACYAKKFALALNEVDFNGWIFRLRIIGGVYIQREHTSTIHKTWYFYHEGLLIIDSDLFAGVVDPIMFGDANMRSISDWYDRIKIRENNSLLIY